MLRNASCKGKNRGSFRATVLLFAVSVRFQSRPTRFHRNEESDEPLGRRRDRRRLRKLVVSIGVRVARVRQLIEHRVGVSFLGRFYQCTDHRGIVGTPDDRENDICQRHVRRDVVSTTRSLFHARSLEFRRLCRPTIESSVVEFS